MNYFRKPDHSYHRVIFEFTDKEMENAGFIKLSLIPSELEILQLLQRIADEELNKINQSYDLQRKKDLWKAKALRLIGFLNNKDKEIKRLRKAKEKLESDVSDMHNSVQTIFKRCNKCGHLNDKNYQCSYCNKH